MKRQHEDDKNATTPKKLRSEEKLTDRLYRYFKNIQELHDDVFDHKLHPKKARQIIEIINSNEFSYPSTAEITPFLGCSKRKENMINLVKIYCIFTEAYHSDGPIFKQFNNLFIEPDEKTLVRLRKLRDCFIDTRNLYNAPAINITFLQLIFIINQLNKYISRLEILSSEESKKSEVPAKYFDQVFCSLMACSVFSRNTLSELISSSHPVERPYFF